jgi:diguanylate cyclase (GGDEF)-like protein
MAFWSKKSEPAPEAQSKGDELGEVALDTLAAVLRALGKTAFSLDGTPKEAIGRRFEGWARHLLIRSRPPARDGRDEGEDDEAPGTTDRDWPGVIAFVNVHRKRENQAVAETVSGLREAVRSFMQAATKLRQISGVADDSTKKGIERLKKAVEKSAPVELKREIMSVASELEALVEVRKKSELAVTQMLAERVRELTGQLEEARREGSTDPLTRLPNRRTLDAVLEELLELCQVTAQPVALALIDVDSFKSVNDTHGHIAGDQVLKLVADQLTRTFLRKYDLVARLGGDEFAVLLRDTTAADAKRMLVKASQNVAAAPAFKGGPTVTLSIGVVDMVLGDTAQSLVERADKALYRAKNGGRNRVEVGEG